MANKEKKPRKPYRTRYRKSWCALVSTHIKNGMSMVDIAKAFGICRKTFYDYIDKYPEFGEAIEDAKQGIVKGVENAMYKRAVGYDKTETKTVMKYDANKNIKGVERTTIEKHYPGDANLMKFILLNRDSENWKDKQDIDVTGKLDIIVKPPPTE